MMKDTDFTKIPYMIFIFNDKNAKIYWIIIFVAFLMISFYTWSAYGNLKSFLLILLYVIIYIGFYSISYYNYLKFFRLVRFFKESDIFFEQKYCKVKIIPCQINLTIPKQNFRTTIKMKEYVDSIPYIKTNMNYIFQYSIKEYGIFQYYKTPIILNVSNILLMCTEKIEFTLISKENLCIENNDIIIKLKNGYKMQLLDFKQKYDKIFYEA